MHFKYHFNFFGHKRKLTRNRFTINSSVLDLKKEIAKNVFESNSNYIPSTDDVRLVFNGRPLTHDDNRTLGECGILNSSCFVTVIIRITPSSSQRYINNK